MQDDAGVRIRSMLEAWIVSERKPAHIEGTVTRMRTR